MKGFGEEKGFDNWLLLTPKQALLPWESKYRKLFPTKWPSDLLNAIKITLPETRYTLPSPTFQLHKLSRKDEIRGLESMKSYMKLCSYWIWKFERPFDSSVREEKCICDKRTIPVSPLIVKLTLAPWTGLLVIASVTLTLTEQQAIGGAAQDRVSLLLKPSGHLILFGSLFSYSFFSFSCHFEVSG